jgi:hypothetical protein
VLPDDEEAAGGLEDHDLSHGRPGTRDRDLGSALAQPRPDHCHPPDPLWKQKESLCVHGPLGSRGAICRPVPSPIEAPISPRLPTESRDSGPFSHAKDVLLSRGSRDYFQRLLPSRIRKGPVYTALPSSRASPLHRFICFSVLYVCHAGRDNRQLVRQRNANVMPTQCQRNANAMPTQCQRVPFASPRREELNRYLPLRNYRDQ